jgi:hypothetical protein
VTGQPRWRATIHYRVNGGTVDVPHDIEELEDLQHIVEAGPNWNTIERIEIVLMRVPVPDMRVEDEQ